MEKMNSLSHLGAHRSRVGDRVKAVKAIAAFAKRKLNPGGILFFELNEFHAEASAAAVKAQGFANVELRKDLNGKLRMLRARRL